MSNTLTINDDKSLHDELYMKLRALEHKLTKDICAIEHECNLKRQALIDQFVKDSKALTLTAADKS